MPGTPEKTGAVVSMTVTTNEALEASPVATTVAVQRTVVEPSGKTLFDGGLQTIFAFGLLLVTL